MIGLTSTLLSIFLIFTFNVLADKYSERIVRKYSLSFKSIVLLIILMIIYILSLISVLYFVIIMGGM